MLNASLNMVVHTGVELEVEQYLYNTLKCLSSLDLKNQSFYKKHSWQSVILSLCVSKYNFCNAVALI